MSLFDKFKKSKKRTEQHAEILQQMECPKCGGIMTLTNGLTYTFHCRGQEVEAINVTAMKCANCGEMMFSWDEAQRIQKFAHESVGWEDKTE